VNSTNLTVYIGQHLRGAVGALVGLIALLSGPFVVVIAAALAYHSLLAVPGFQPAMAGIGAAAIGLLARMALISVQNAMRKVESFLVMIATFAAVGIFHFPLLLVVLVVGPVSVALAWWRRSSDA
jgi:chromate transporter